MVNKGFFATRGSAIIALAPGLRGRARTTAGRSGRDADADRARHACAAQFAIAGWVFGEILLMIVRGEIEFARRRDLGGDGADTLRRQRLLIHSLRRVGGLPLRIAKSVDRRAILGAD